MKKLLIITCYIWTFLFLIVSNFDFKKTKEQIEDDLCIELKLNINGKDKEYSDFKSYLLGKAEKEFSYTSRTALNVFK